MMVELIARHSAIPVNVVSDGQVLEPNCLFIVPPNHDVDIDGDRLVLTRAGDETRPKPSVDRFFHSLAAQYGKNAIGVILSGTGSDGAEGIRAIKAAGGLTMAQEETTAKYSGMPNSAMETGQVDIVLNPSELAKKICEMVESESVLVAKEPDEANPSFENVLTLIRKELGSDFTQYKIPTIKRRLAKRLVAIGADDIAEYYKILQNDPREIRKLAQEFLVSVTSFFRDSESFAALGKTVGELIEKKNENDELRFWSAGCATGEEAYSLAMLICSRLERQGKTLAFRVFATDLDTEAITKARVGIYNQRDIAEMPAEFLDKYFERRGDYFEVKKSLRDSVVFARQDLIQSPPFVKLDLICCRNVIIYFEPKLQQKIFEIFSYALKPGGLLFLGKSEAITGAIEIFEPVDKKHKLFVKKASAPKTLPSVARGTINPVDMVAVRKKISVRPSPVQLAQTQMLERYGIAGAIVDTEGTIQTTIGNVSQFLKVPSGLDAFRLQNLLPKSSSVEFQLLLRKAAKSDEVQLSRAFRLSENAGKPELFQIQISRLKDLDENNTHTAPLLLVTFDQIASTDRIAPEIAHSDGDLALRAAELEQELAATKEHLQTVIEELGVTNEELQSTNEELSSTNEELQSTNEELETTNEEFQSTNEELTTLNEEMNVKSYELRLVNTDLENIQVSIGVPMLVVDEQQRLQRFNPSATELFDVSHHDTGRALSRLSCRCEIDEFAAKVQSVIDTGQINESTVEAYRSVYQMRITPRRSEDKKIVGAVIVFFNNTDLIKAEQSLRKSETRIRGMINGTSSLIFLKDMNGLYLSANQAFFDHFALKENQVVGKSDREIFGEEFAGRMRNGDLEAILKRKRVEKQEQFSFGGSTSTFLVSRFPLTEDGDSNPYAVGTVAIDISKEMAAQDALKKSESLYRGVVEDQSVFVVRYDTANKITFVNTAFLRYFGGAAADYIGHPLGTIIDPVDRSYVNDELRRISTTNPILQFEHRCSRFGSGARWIRWINKAIFGLEDNIHEIQAVGFDVTEYRQQTDQMVQREMLFSNIFTYTTDFLTVFKVSAGGELLLESFNRSVEDGGGYTYAQFLGRNVRDLVTSQHRNEILAKYKACVTDKEPQTFDEELSLQGGIKYLTTTVIPVVNNAGTVERVVALSRDISKYKIAEAELNAAKAAAEIANETKSDFLASMSHELRSPLNVVIGMSELLQGSDLTTEERDQVRSIQRSGKVLLTLIEDILDISKIEAGKTKLEFSNFSLRDLLKEITETFKPQAEAKNVKFVVDLPDDHLDNFIGDVNRVRQILVNLLGNAVKFTEKGKVELTISSVGHRTTGRRLVRFDVKDSGIGIPEEHHSRIFKKFSQVDTGLGRRYGGTGLGLVISQRLTTLMNGQIGFQSEWNKGSTFWFELPLSIAKKTRSAQVQQKAVNEPPPKTGPLKARILAVDDSPDSRMYLEMLLARLGHDFVVVDSGEAALTAAQNNTFDIVLMDVQMPGMDGYETTARLRKISHPNNSLPIIALTANAMVGDSEKCFDSGMNDYITKPINVDLLRNAIRKWAAVSARRDTGSNPESPHAFSE